MSDIVKKNYFFSQNEELYTNLPIMLLSTFIVAYMVPSQKSDIF